MKQNIKHQISSDDIGLLKNLTDELEALKKQIDEDTTLVNASDSEGIIILDLASITKLLTDIAQENKKQLEKAMLCITVAPHLLNEYDMDTLNESLDSLSDVSSLFEAAESGASIDWTITKDGVSAIPRTSSENDQDIQAIRLPFLSVLTRAASPYVWSYGRLLFNFANIVAKIDGTICEAEENVLKAIFAVTHPNADKLQAADNDDETLEDVISELEALIGLEAVKKSVNDLISFIKVQEARKEAGLKSAAMSYHLVFTGNPGTGKTTVARIVAKIYKHLGILKTGTLTETDRAGMVGMYQGHTAAKVNEVVAGALDGVLFIDEAYALVSNVNDSFGQEAVATLIKRVEDERQRLVVILAGYPDEMESFINTNPGIKSRFSRYIHFPDYKPKELLAILQLMCRINDYKITEESIVKVKQYFEQHYAGKNKNFGNGRLARNTFERIMENQANRIVKEKKITSDLLVTIIADDVPAFEN